MSWCLKWGLKQIQFLRLSVLFVVDGEHFFYNGVGISGETTPNCRMVNGQWIEKDLEGSGRSQIGVLSSHLTWRDWEQPRSISLRVGCVCVPGEIQTEHLRYTTQLGGVCSETRQCYLAFRTEGMKQFCFSVKDSKKCSIREIDRLLSPSPTMPYLGWRHVLTPRGTY